MTVPDIIIAIDGYSSTGKSSFAKMAAREFGFLYLDSGAMYRGVTYAGVQAHCISADAIIDEAGLRHVLDGLDLHFGRVSGATHTFMDSRDIEDEIRTMAISSLVSPVSALPFVREYVDGRLHKFAEGGRVVMDGRDIGTTVFPDAGIKVFMTASIEVRTQRRLDEMLGKGEKSTFVEVRKNLLDRDYLDSHRQVSPLTKAADAFVLDNSELSFNEEVSWLRGVIQGKFGIKE